MAESKRTEMSEGVSRAVEDIIRPYRVPMERVWRRLRTYRGRPELGRRDDITISTVYRAEDGTAVGGGEPEYRVKGRVVQVGEHWSDPASGTSGWHVLYEYRRPERAPAEDDLS